MDYHLKPAGKRPVVKSRIVPSRPGNLRRGGGRKDSPGWTEHKRKANRKRLDKLRPFIKTGVTIIPPSNATAAQLKKLNESCCGFCKKTEIQAYAVWEGPNPHLHIALGIAWDAELEGKWRSRLAKAWLRVFDKAMADDAFLWNPAEQPDQIASYFSKTSKDGLVVKGDGPAFAWLTFCPTWKTGFRKLLKSRAGANQSTDRVQDAARKKRVTPLSHLPPEKEGHSVSPYYTQQTPENESHRPELYDLWEASPMRVETETLEHVLPGLPPRVWRVAISLHDEAMAINSALALHASGILLTAFLNRTQTSLICITSAPTIFGEDVEANSLRDESSLRPYYAKSFQAVAAQ